MTCIFCDKAEEAVLENDLAYAIYDEYPVNEGHMLIIPKRHFSSYFEANQKEHKALRNLIYRGKDLLEEEYDTDGYNIGVNIGQEAGQTIMHLHIHLIPRYTGDVENPGGGVRNLKEAVVEWEGEK